MGVSVYVMPLENYLRGDFKTTWESREETAGKPGSRIAPEGLAGPPEPRAAADVDIDVAVSLFCDQVETHAVRRPEWDADSTFRNASSLSYHSFGSACRRAQQWSYRVRLPRLERLVPPQIWLPMPFEPTIRVTAPWDRDAEVTAVSSVGLLSEFRRLQELMTEDPLMVELQALPDGSPLTGSLAEFDGELFTLGHLRKLAELSIEHHVPVIVEG